MILVQDIQVGCNQEGYEPVQITTSRGMINFRYYPVENARKGVIWVGGVGGGWDTPAKGLYPKLCQELQGEAIASLWDAIASLRIRYRYSISLQESVLDVLAGICYLQTQGIESIALIGHSFGGAVVIQAALHSLAVRTVVTLATQSYGAELAPQLADRCSLLLLHGTADSLLSPNSSLYIYHLAKEPKHLIFYPNAGHNLDEVADQVRQVIRDWTIEQLNRPLP